MRIIAKAVQNKLCGLSQNFLQKVREGGEKSAFYLCVFFWQRPYTLILGVQNNIPRWNILWNIIPDFAILFQMLEFLFYLGIVFCSLSGYKIIPVFNSNVERFGIRV